MSEPCGECHLKPGETCDICGSKRPLVSADGINLILSEAGVPNSTYLAVKIAEAVESGKYLSAPPPSER